MYLLYVVPIQGRDAEISHMKYITQEFIGLKADIDGLIINDKINLPIARSFELGTLSSVGSGALSIMPMSSYIEASGTLMVNEQNDFLKVCINGIMTDISSELESPIGYYSRYYTNKYLNFYPYLINLTCKEYEKCPPEPMNFTIFNRTYNITTKRRDWYSLHDNNGVLNLTIPHTYFNISTDASGTEPEKNKSIVLYYENSTTYDLVLETWDNRTWKNIPWPSNRSWIGEKTLIENLTIDEEHGTNYTINILNDIIINDTTQYYDYYLKNTQSLIENNSNFYTTAITNQIEATPPRIGSFQYASSNRYWVNQNLLYEMGGLFLLQPSDQGSSITLVPSIAVTPIKNIKGDYQLKVSINNIRITDTEDISGSVSAQIFTKIDRISHNLFKGTTEFVNFPPPPDSIKFYKLRESEDPNTYAIWLKYIPDEELDDLDKIRATELWKRGFDQIKTITNKTLSDTPGLPDDYNNWIYNFRIEDDAGADSEYSANMLISSNAKNDPDIRDYCNSNFPVGNADNCNNEIIDFLSNGRSSEGDPFILDYIESEVSLVMQSGAL